MPTYNDFDTANWTKSNAVVNSGISDPDGGSAAFEHVHDAASGASYLVSNGITLEVGAVYGVSIYLKGNTADWYSPSLVSVTPLNLLTYVDATNGALGVTDNDTYDRSITDVGSGWYFYKLKFTNQSDTAGQFRLYLAEGDNDLAWASASGESLYIYNLSIDKVLAGGISGPGLGFGMMGRMGA